MTKAKRQLLALSVRDGMTGLYNRRGMEIRLREMLDGSREGELLFVSVIDMDGLKKINDTYGHSEGDFGIRMVGNAVAQNTRVMRSVCAQAGMSFIFWESEPMRKRRSRKE